MGHRPGTKAKREREAADRMGMQTLLAVAVKRWPDDPRLRALATALGPLVRSARHRAQQSERAPLKRERPRCGARCRSKDGAPCEAPVVWNAERREMRPRCRMHGGNNYGPKTPEGKARALVNLKAATERRRAAKAKAEADNSADGGEAA